MGKTWSLCTLALALLGMGICRAETILNTDFSQGSAGWVLNLDAQLLTVSGCATADG